MNPTLLTGFGPKIMVRAPFERFFLKSAALRWRHGTRMSEDDPDARRLADIEERLRKARGKRGEEARAQETAGSSLGAALRLSIDLVAAVAVGTGIGWLLDRWLGTLPLFLILFFFFGVAAGFLNVIRVARKMEEQDAQRADKD